MISRRIIGALKNLSEVFPVVTILGPRQSGKTTLAKEYFKNYSYVNLEEPQDRQLAMEDPYGLFKKYPTPIIIDEVQRVPEILSVIQVLADKKQKNGMFILTGSHQPKMHEKISQSLSGRTGILKLLPLSIEELSMNNIILDRDEYILKGFMPAIHQKNIDPSLYYSNYYATYVERDVRQLVNISNQHSFEIFIKLLAGRVGQLVNLSSMSNEVGVSTPTLSSWLSILEASYIIYRLPCYFKNFGKRLIKSQKIYFTEIGLVAYLLGINDISQVSRDPLLGNLFENLVIVEALKTCYNKGEIPNLYFFRDKNGFEIDLIIDSKRTLTPIEIKSASTYNHSFATSLNKFKDFSEEVTNPTVIYSGDFETTQNNIRIINFKETSSVIP